MLIPSALQGILWSKSVKKLNLEKDKAYIINQILAFGNLDHYKWLFKTYALEEIVEVFCKHPLKIYQKSTFNFVKNILLELENFQLRQEKYVTTLPRNIRQN